MNVEQARFNMIEQQIRPWDVLDDRVLSLLAEVPREQFVPETLRSLAFVDLCIPLDHNEVMMPPKMEARVLQALAVQDTDTVLEIGTGSGYLTALLAKLAKHVYSVDLQTEFTNSASSKLGRAGIRNVTLETGDASAGWPKHGPYDVIAVTGSCPVLPIVFQEQLKLNGRLFVIVGQDPIMEALLITRTGDSAWARESLFETSIPPLKNVEAPIRFVF
jgi:protein-L-isoaspartate(D-aspartate) O-methyltransferase